MDSVKPTKNDVYKECITLCKAMDLLVDKCKDIVTRLNQQSEKHSGMPPLDAFHSVNAKYDIFLDGIVQYVHYKFDVFASRVKNVSDVMIHDANIKDSNAFWTGALACLREMLPLLKDYEETLKTGFDTNSKLKQLNTLLYGSAAKPKVYDEYYGFGWNRRMQKTSTMSVEKPNGYDAYFGEQVYNDTVALVEMCEKCIKLIEQGISRGRLPQSEYEMEEQRKAQKASEEKSKIKGRFHISNIVTEKRLAAGVLAWLVFFFCTELQIYKILDGLLKIDYGELGWFCCFLAGIVDCFVYGSIIGHIIYKIWGLFFHDNRDESEYKRTKEGQRHQNDDSSSDAIARKKEQSSDGLCVFLGFLIGFAAGGMLMAILLGIFELVAYIGYLSLAVAEGAFFFLALGLIIFNIFGIFFRF